MKHQNLIWSSDFSENTGEGQLARSFVRTFFKYNKNINRSMKFTCIKKSLIDKNYFRHKYIEPTFYAFKLIFLQKKYKKIIFCNYLPLWNFLIFLFLPSKTILGPITGGIYTGKVKNLKLFIRKYIFPLLYRISLKIIFIKFNKVIFSTNILENYIVKKDKKKCLFNFVIINFNSPNKTKNKKKYFLIYYNRDHETKKSDLYLKLINQVSLKEKILVLGNKIEIKSKNIIYKKFIPKKNLILYLKSSVCTFASPENLYSLFSIDAYNSGCLILYHNKLYENSMLKNKNFISVDLVNGLNVKFIKKYKFNYKDKKFNLQILQKKNDIIEFIKNY